MYAALALEWIGWDTDRELQQLGERSLRRPQVLRWYRSRVRPPQRAPVKGRIDYTDANSKGSRKVMVHYLLPSDACYEITCFTSWRRRQHYWLLVRDDAVLHYVTEKEARAWLRGN